METDWVMKPLGDCADLVSGGTPSKKNPDYWGGAIPWLSAKDMRKLRIHDTQDHVSQEGADNGTRLVPAGTPLLLTRGMTLLNDVPIAIPQTDMTFNQDVKALIAKDGVREDFLVYALLAKKPDLLNMVDLAGHGTGRLNTDELKSLEIAVPVDAGEQRAIAHILGTLDDKIELNRRMNETLEATARAIFKSWFVDFDPVRAKQEGREPAGMSAELAELFPDSFEDSELGEIPKGWDVHALDQVADYVNGAACQKYAAVSGEPRRESRRLV